MLSNDSGEIVRQRRTSRQRAASPAAESPDRSSDAHRPIIGRSCGRRPRRPSAAGLSQDRAEPTRSSRAANIEDPRNSNVDFDSGERVRFRPGAEKSGFGQHRLHQPQILLMVNRSLSSQIVLEGAENVVIPDHGISIAPRTDRRRAGPAAAEPPRITSSPAPASPPCSCGLPRPAAPRRCEPRRRPRAHR